MELTRRGLPVRKQSLPLRHGLPVAQQKTGAKKTEILPLLLPILG
jgi:hypothetical protein